MKTRRRAVPWIALALLVCTGPRPDPMEATGWLEIRTMDFAVVGNAPPDALRALAWELSLFHDLVAKVTTAKVEPSPVPVRLYVFAEAAQAKPFTGGAGGILMQRLPGYIAVLSAGGPYFNTRAVLFHEYAHYVLRSHRSVAYPRWYDEGLSEFLSTVRYRDDAVIIGAAPTDRLRTLDLLGPMPLDELFGAEELVGKEIYRFYASAWALVHHLNRSQADRARLRRYVNLLVRGEDWRSAYAASFDQDLEALQAAVDAHVENLGRGVRSDFHVRADSLRTEREWSESAVSPAEIAYQLGYVSRLMNEPSSGPEDFDPARALFEQSIRHDASHARARAALAWCHAIDGRWEDSAALLARATAEAPRDPRVVLEAGRILAMRARTADADGAEAEAALTTLELAVELGPELAEAHAALGRLHAAAGREQRAIAAFERARNRGAWSPPVEVELAQEYLRVGERERAEALLVPVAADTHGGATRDRARQLLESVRADAEHASER